MKKVLIFALAYYPKFIGGDAVAVKEITDRIDPSDIEFHMVTLRFDSALPRYEKIGNVHIYRIGFAKKNPTSADLKKFPLHLTKFIFQFSAAFKALKLHRKHRFDATWAMMAHSAGVPAAIFKLLKPQVPYILTLQEGDPPEYIERMMRPVRALFNHAFMGANVVQVISTFLGDWARRKGFKGPLEVIPNGVDTKRFISNPVPHEGVVLITTSRLVSKNGIDDVIRALPKLSGIRFVILGMGPDEALLKELAKELGVSDRVEFVGYVDHTRMMQYLNRADIFIRPSRSEGFGNSFIEAFAAGLPVIATQEGGIADFLFDAKRNPDKPTTGWVVDKDNFEQIAEAVQDIVNNSERVKEVVERAKKLAIEHYSWDLVAKDMKEKVFSRVFQN